LDKTKRQEILRTFFNENLFDEYINIDNDEHWYLNKTIKITNAYGAPPKNLCYTQNNCHIAIYEAFKDLIPDDCTYINKCGNDECINPDHHKIMLTSELKEQRKQEQIARRSLIKQQKEEIRQQEILKRENSAKLYNEGHRRCENCSIIFNIDIKTEFIHESQLDASNAKVSRVDWDLDVMVQVIPSSFCSIECFLEGIYHRYDGCWIIPNNNKDYVCYEKGKDYLKGLSQKDIVLIAKYGKDNIKTEYYREKCFKDEQKCLNPAHYKTPTKHESIINTIHNNTMHDFRRWYRNHLFSEISQALFAERFEVAEAAVDKLNNLNIDEHEFDYKQKYHNENWKDNNKKYKE
jgi:hypothetical protein